MNRPKQNRQLAGLAAVAVGMFGFAFALVPLYDVFCELTGLNGKTATSEFIETQPAEVSDRMVTIQFLAQVGNGLPWEFRPTEQQMRVQVGKLYTTNYYARNRSTRVVNGQAVPSVSPGQAAIHLKKIECFCFTTQTLEAGAETEMAVRFMVDAELPDDISTLSLSYTVFLVPTDEHDTKRTAFQMMPDDTEQELRL